MNEGLDPRTIEPDAGEYSSRWWTETARMIDRGWRYFCKKRGMDPKQGGLRDQIHEDAVVGMASWEARRRKQ